MKRPDGESRVIVLIVAAALLTLPAAGCGNKNKNGNANSDVRIESNPREPNEFEKSDKDPPFTAATRFAAGQLAESQGDLARAMAQYQEALKLDKNHKPALFRLGVVYTQQSKFNEAVAVWQRYIQATGQSAAAYSNLAYTYEAAKQYDAAEQAYRTALSKDPDYPPARTNYGLMLARRGRLDDAIAQLSTVLKPAEVHYNLGSVMEQEGKVAEAKAYYRKALELDPKLVDARARLARMK